MTSYRHSELFSLFWFDSVSKWHCDLRWAHPGPSGMSSSDRRWRSKFPSSVGERGAIKDGNSAAVGQQHLLWLWVPASHRKGNFHSVQNIAILNWLFKPSKKKRSTFLYTRTFFMLIQKYWHLPNNIKTISYINMAPNYKSKSQKEVKHKSNTQCVNIPCQNKGWAQLVSTKLLPDNAAAFSEAPTCCFSISFLALLFVHGLALGFVHNAVPAQSLKPSCLITSPK